MADEIDVTEERTSKLVEADVAEIRRKAAQIPKGVPGHCDFCGEFSWRLVGGNCAPCRDKHKLP